jgi:ArsR family transcriptional regulator
MDEAKFLKCMVDEHRRQIIACLGTGEKCVNEIIDITNLEQTLVSFHLKALKNCGLINCRRDGQKIIYKVSNPVIIDILNFIKEHSSEIPELNKGEECK